MLWLPESVLRPLMSSVLQPHFVEGITVTDVFEGRLLANSHVGENQNRHWLVFS